MFLLYNFHNVTNESKGNFMQGGDPVNGLNTIEEILSEPVYVAQSTPSNETWPDTWPDSVHHQSWHDSWRNSH